MAKDNSKRGLDEQLLEGGGSGAGSGVKNTKYSNMPSIQGNANIIDDIRKLTKDTSHLRGGAKKATDLAEDRAARRMAVRAAGTAGAGAVAKNMSGSNAMADSDSKNTDDYEDMTGSVNMDNSNPTGVAGTGMKKGGMTASSRGDGCAQRGKTKGTIVMCGGGMYKK